MMKHRQITILAILFLFFSFFGIGTRAQSPQDRLTREFESPPNQAKPRVWWHWMNGNVTEKGIDLDLHWMNRIGIGGFQTFDADLGTPLVVKKRLVYMTPGWKRAFQYATKLADRLNLEETIASSPGWSEAGGPWVLPSHAMKKVVWSVTRLQGGQPFSGVLPRPPSVSGPFQNIPIEDFLAPLTGQASKIPPEYYRDIAVLAYRAPDNDVPVMRLNPQITSSKGSIDVALLSDGDLVKTTPLPIAPIGRPSWIQYAFSRPQTVYAVTLVTHRSEEQQFGIFMAPQDSARALESSDDGEHFRKIVTIPVGGSPEYTVAFPKVTARFFRVTFTTNALPPNPLIDVAISLGIHLPSLSAPADYHIAEIVLHTTATVNRFEEKAAFTPLPDLYALATPHVESKEAICKSDVVDLTSKMKPDGKLDWIPPPGTWVVLRMGYSLLGITNHPASPDATGLEVDKLNRSDVSSYMKFYLNNYKSAVGPSWMGKRGVRYVVTDSWEAGAQNWTDNMIEEFTKRRGYDPIPWMPVLTGRVIESSEESDRFLWDFRKTIADLTSDNYYGQIEASLRERGMGHYGESHEEGRAFVADGMEVKKDDDIPMGAMWARAPSVKKELYGFDADIRESASVAHIYGQNLVAAESMTADSSPWAWSPKTLKPTADKELAEGVNRFVIHCSVHQPLVDKAPGLTLGPFGQWFTRNETWAEEAAPWITYLARSSYLLQQGRFDADIIYFYGEDSNLTAIFADRSPSIPQGYNYDYINADALIHELSVDNGHIKTKSGMSYRIMGLDPYSQHMSLPVLRAIYKLVKDGAIVGGPKPTDDPSLADDQAEFRKLSDELFGDGTGVHRVGRGTVYVGRGLESVLDALKVAPDFDYTKPETDTSILFVHRRLADGDLYFIDNRNARVESVDATFRVKGKAPELWFADTGRSEPVSYRIEGGRTTVPLHLDPWGTVFVIFRKPADGMSRTLPHAVEAKLATLEGPWTVSFESNRGAPSTITLDHLMSWSGDSNNGVKYFSGTASYTGTIYIPAEWLKTGVHLWLNLGDVEDLADVTVNHRHLGVVWKMPYKIEMTGILKAGTNSIIIKVTNLWVNRLIGDLQPNARKYTFTDFHPYKANSPLLPSGLLGPVSISSVIMQQ